MGVVGLTLRDFRCYEQAEVGLAEGLTVITGPNGAGKTNLLEALYFGCTGRSCRTTNEREIVRFGAGTTRVVVRCEREDGPHELAVGFTPGEPKRMRATARWSSAYSMPPPAPGSVFLPDRLELIKGAPTVRRAHLDQLVTALWPARAGTRRAYAQSLAQRNALLSPHARRAGEPVGGESWDLQLARHGIALMADRDQAVQTIAELYSALAPELGLEGGASVSLSPALTRHRGRRSWPLSWPSDEPGDLERGFTGHGPHRDDARAPARRAATCAPTAPRASSAWRLLDPAAGRARRDRRRSRLRSADAARRRHERARPYAPRGPGDVCVMARENR